MTAEHYNGQWERHKDSKEMTPKLKQVFSTFVSRKRLASNVFKLWYQRSFLEI